jgi:hypothetical protein
MTVQIVNNSGLADSDVYVQLGPLGGGSGYSGITPNTSVPLSSLTNDQFGFSAIDSGRITVSYGGPVPSNVFPAHADGRCGPKPCKADVGISGHAEPQPIRRGETARLKITVKNDGPDGALGVWMQSDVPRQRVRGTRITDAYASLRDGTDDNAGNGHVAMTAGVRRHR